MIILLQQPLAGPPARSRVRRCPGALALGVALVGLAVGPSAMAINRLVLTVGQLASPTAAASGVSVSLDLTHSPGIAVRIGHLQVRQAGVPALDEVRLTCGTLAAGPREFACRTGKLAARSGTFGAVSATLSADFDPHGRAWNFVGTDVPLAGGRLQISGLVRPGDWSLTVRAAGVDLEQAAQVARPWVSVPAGYKVSGHADAQIALTSRPALTLKVTAQSSDFNATNEPGTIVAQQVSASLSGTLVRQKDTLTVEVLLHGSRGQTLAGPVLLDFSANPLTLDAALQRSGNGPFVVSRLAFEQRNLIQAHATGVAQPGAHPRILSAHVAIASIKFPAAYASYLQLALAATELGSLQSSGEASGAIDVADNAIVRLDGSLHDVNFTDPGARVLIEHVSGDIHWTAASGSGVPASTIAWQRGAHYGLSGGPVRLRFVTWQRNFALIGGDTRLPVFDGAVIVHTLVGRELGTAQAKIDFDADVTPISMSRLSKAFGWPVMNGAVAGHIPLVRYRDRELTFDGDLVAKVFDGTITGSHIVLKNPLGPWPSLSADVLARGLDLDLVTHTFAFGSITGRIDVDVRGLQLFNWSPVAFDARLYTTPGDRSPHRVSQNAVTRIAGLGGAAGAVKAALESGVLKFFHTFRYDRVGLGCRLQNEVCTMSGVAPAPRGGYYLVAGSGLPRLDIIGNVRRVDWETLTGQVAESMREHNFVVNTGRK
ncbi:MAG TPA: hypothetical protein VGR92_03635 [Steroidobacteraceae bacterium]|nr:hypothetical protein [Steroidobacteraceae bacterium]